MIEHRSTLEIVREGMTMLDLESISDQVSLGTRKALHLLDQLADDDEPVTITINFEFASNLWIKSRELIKSAW